LPRRWGPVLQLQFPTTYSSSASAREDFVIAGETTQTCDTAIQAVRISSEGSFGDRSTGARRPTVHQRGMGWPRDVHNIRQATARLGDRSQKSNVNWDESLGKIKTGCDQGVPATPPTTRYSRCQNVRRNDVPRYS
jgi:hypothetical protein